MLDREVVERLGQLHAIACGTLSMYGSRGGAPQRERPAKATDAFTDDDPDSIPFVHNRSRF